MIETPNHSAPASSRGLSRKQQNLLLLGCTLLISILWWMQRTPYLNVADDSGRYMVLGESIARTGDLRLINQVNRPLDTLYPPGFPLLIALWLRLTGWPPSAVVIPVKATLLLLTLLTLPMLLKLLNRAGLSPAAQAGAMFCYSFSPSLIGYANEVMSDLPLLAFCLLSISLVETDQPSAAALIAALASAAAAFTMRTSGIALFLVLAVYYTKKFSKKMAAAAWLNMFITAGLWLYRNHHIAATHPNMHYSSYLHQFTLRDPMRMNAGRIQLNPLGIASRIKFGFPTYIGMIPRAILYLMAPPNSPYLYFFYLAAIPLCLLILAGLVIAWKQKMKLTVAFSVLFWLTAAMWPWQNPRFLFPLVPFMLLFAALALQTACEQIPARTTARVTAAFAVALLIGYETSVYARIVPLYRKPVLPGYTLGRTPAEAGFYAACAWLNHNTPHNTLVMGKPAYLLHLYSQHPTTQIEPTSNPKVQEKAYICKQNVVYLVEDSWQFGFVTHKLLAPYFARYANRWKLVWQDSRSGVRIWQRIPGTCK